MGVTLSLPIAPDGTKLTRAALTVTAINISTAGDNTILTPASGRALRVVKLVLVADSNVDITLKEGTVTQGQTAKSGPMQFGVSMGWSFDGNMHPLPLVADKSLVINLSAAVQVAGFVLSYEV